MKKATPRQGWYLVHFKPNSHKIAELNLNRQGFKTFLPMQEVSKRTSLGFENYLTPLFPGYMFVSFDPISSHWIKIKSTIGVLRLVSFEQKLAEVPPHIMREIEKSCDKSGNFLGLNSFEIGEEVRIIKGAVSNFPAKIEQMRGKKRVSV